MMKKIFSAFVILTVMHSGAQAQIIATFAGTGHSGYTGDGLAATQATLSYPYGVAADNRGHVFIADKNNNVIRSVSSAGVVTTFAGCRTGGAGGDGGPATAAALGIPTAIVVDHYGNVFIADFGDNNVRKVDTNGIITTVAGTGMPGFYGDGGPASAAKLFQPSGLAVDDSENIYIADYNNNRVRVINSSGIIRTFAGNGTVGYSGDGHAASSAELNYPAAIAVDHQGNVYIGDTYNYAIRKVAGSGIISTYAGNGYPAFTGTGIPATAASMGSPTGLAADGDGNVYIADKDNDLVWKVNSSGIINLFAGDAISGYTGDGQIATTAEINIPAGLAVDKSGTVYICDVYNNAVRSVSQTYLSVPRYPTSDNSRLQLWPNPGHGKFSLLLSSSLSELVPIRISNVLGAKMKEFTLATNTTIDINLDLPSGVYFIEAISTEGERSSVFIIDR